MARHDFEEILDNVKTIISDNLSTKLTAITTDKGDSIVLPTLNSEAFFIQTLDERIANFDPFLVYGISNIENESVSNGGHTSQKIFIECTMVLADNGRSDINRIMFRYARALKEIFEENWQILDSSTRINVTQSNVVGFENLDSSATYKASGVELEINLA